MAAFDAIVEADHQLFFYLNGMHQPWMDGLMFLLSDRYFWIPLYAWILYLMFKKYGSSTWLILLCAVGLILFSDQTTNVFKAMVQRYRPTHNPSFGALVHTVNNYKGGTYGFFSGHAANAFALTMFSLSLLKPTTKYLYFILITYACLTSYSRIYLGVHYPLDIIVGALSGLGLGFLFKNFTKVLLEKWNIQNQS
jgi:undecaprenyl-diphosphatase